MSRFVPVFLDAPLEGRVSQTMLRAFNGCPRSGYLYAKTRGAYQTMEMLRGSAVHEIKQRATELMIAEGESSIPPELVKAIVNEVLAEFAVPVEEHDYMREMAYRWAGEWKVDPEQVIAVEKLIVLKLGKWDVRCKVDFAERRDEGSWVYVADYKSARGAPGFEEVSRKRSRDGSLAAKSFQLILYALALAYGLPVTVNDRILKCVDCGGEWPRVEVESRVAPSPGGCPSCGGRVRALEEAEPFPLAAHAERFELEYVYPGIEADGLMLRRGASLTQLELHEYRESFEALLWRLQEAEEGGDWPAVVSDAACSECSAKLLCPIPVELRDNRGKINTLEDAIEASEVLDRRSDIDAALRKELKAWAKATGLTIPVGSDREWAFVVKPVERIADKEAMWAAIERAAQYGEAFDRDDFVRRGTSTNFVVRKLDGDETEVVAGGE